jgi:O-methyltransferase involved in polyketide biosynthesis
MQDRPAWVPDDVDITRPSVARVYDYYLGGSHNFAADREFAREVIAVMPDMPRVAQENRAFLRRAVRHLCDAGVDQFLDLGSGIPTAGSVHEVAPDATVVYVDHDPVAVTHSRTLLAGQDRVVVAAADLRDPDAVLADPIVSATLDTSRPVAVLLVSVLHFVADDRDPAGFIARYLRDLPAGSHLVLSHATAESRPGAADAQALYNRSRSPQGMRMRSRAEVEALFDGVRLLEPGVVRIPHWRPESPDDVPADVDSYPGFAGVGRV